MTISSSVPSFLAATRWLPSCSTCSSSSFSVILQKRREDEEEEEKGKAKCVGLGPGKACTHRYTKREGERGRDARDTHPDTDTPTS